MSESNLADEIAAYHAMRARLLTEHGPAWVVVLGAQVKGAFPSFDSAADFAVRSFGNAKFLIRHTEEHAPHIPLVVVEAV